MGHDPQQRARVSLTLRLICGYFLRSLLPFLTFILWNITGHLNVNVQWVMMSGRDCCGGDRGPAADLTS